MPAERLELVEGWGMVDRAMGYVYRPSTVEGVREVLELARRSGRPVVPRGSGYSYGDAALNAENIVLDLTRMKRILDWEPDTGVITVEPGVTIRDLWRYVLEDGWWPAVVPGAMYPTVGGCVAVNVHGKNNWRAGSFVDHVLALEMMLPSGEIVRCEPEERRELVLAAVGSLGLLGVVTRVTLRLQQVASGLLAVQELAAPSLKAMFDVFEEHLATASYVVGWIDAFAGGRSLGRGLVQVARYVENDPASERTLRPSHQELGDTLLGFVPRSRIWLGMKLLVNDPGMRALNEARYRMGALRQPRTAFVPHAQFHFFHDFVPDWKRSFWPGGIIQYQVFVPESRSRAVFAALLEGSQQAGLVPYLTVFKRHRPDDALLSYGVDGYSLSLDYHVTAGNEGALRALLERFTCDVVLPAGGRFYPAKDSVLTREAARRSLGEEAVKRFLGMKGELDPNEVLQSDLYRRTLRY